MRFAATLLPRTPPSNIVDEVANIIVYNVDTDENHRQIDISRITLFFQPTPSPPDHTL